MEILVEQVVDAEGFGGFADNWQPAEAGNGQIRQFVFDTNFFGAFFIFSPTG